MRRLVSPSSQLKRLPSQPNRQTKLQAQLKKFKKKLKLWTQTQTRLKKIKRQKSKKALCQMLVLSTRERHISSSSKQ